MPSNCRAQSFVELIAAKVSLKWRQSGSSSSPDRSVKTGGIWKRPWSGENTSSRDSSALTRRQCLSEQWADVLEELLWSEETMVHNLTRLATKFLIIWWSYTIDGSSRYISNFTNIISQIFLIIWLNAVLFSFFFFLYIICMFYFLLIFVCVLDDVEMREVRWAHDVTKMWHVWTKRWTNNNNKKSNDLGYLN